jgi:hypothetical protein
MRYSSTPPTTDACFGHVQQWLNITLKNTMQPGLGFKYETGVSHKTTKVPKVPKMEWFLRNERQTNSRAGGTENNAAARHFHPLRNKLPHRGGGAVYLQR